MSTAIERAGVFAALRQVGDRELFRRFPGWFCLMFHRLSYDDNRGVYVLAYTVQMSKDGEPQIVTVELWESRYLDSSIAFVPVGQL